MEDYADFMELVCLATNEAQRDFVLHSLKDFHGVPAEEVAPEAVRTRAISY